MKKTMVRSLALAFVGSLLLAGSALALPTIKVQATGASGTVTLADGDLADYATADGIVSFNDFDGLGSKFIFNAATGNTKPAIGTPGAPSMFLHGNATTSSSSGGLFTVQFSEDFFGPLDQDFTRFMSTMSGVGGTQSLKVYYSLTNDLFERTVNIADLSTNGSVLAGVPLESPFSLTMVATLQLGKGQSGSFDDSVGAPVPEPATMLLLGTGLVGLAGARRRKAKKA